MKCKADLVDPRAADHLPDFNLFSDEDLASLSLLELYCRQCNARGLKPDPEISRQLPSTVKGRPHRKIIALDASKSYTGAAGFCSILPVIAACSRLTHLFAPRSGIDAPVGLALVRILLVHPAISDINLSQNDLGTDVGQALIQLLLRNRKICSLDLTDTLIIPPIKKKIDAHLASNRALRDEQKRVKYSYAGGEQVIIGAESECAAEEDEEEATQRKLAEEQETIRKLRDEALKREVADRLPAWAPVALTEIEALLYKHRRFLLHVISVFDPVDRLSEWCTAANFLRAMRILGIASLMSDIERCRTFADLFQEYDRSLDHIRFGGILAALRVHVVIGAADTTYPSTQVRDVVDKLYDSRAAVLRALEVMDVDSLHSVTVSELRAGIAALVQLPPTAGAITSVLDLCKKAAQKEGGDSIIDNKPTLNEESLLIYYNAQFLDLLEVSEIACDTLLNPLRWQSTSRSEVLLRTIRRTAIPARE